MLKFNLKKYFFLMVTCALYSCQSYYQMEMHGSVTKQEQKKPNLSTIELRVQEAGLPLPKCVLILLHGLTMDASECDPLKKAVEEKFGKKVKTIQPKCREGWASARLSIDEQAKKVVVEIKEILRNSYPQYSELKALPINLFGYSQGGLVACMIAANHRHTLNIKTVMAAHAPLSGTDVLENTRSDVNAFNEKSKSGLEAIGHPKTSLFEAQSLGILLNNCCWKPGTHFFFKGVRDMRTNSTCTRDIKAFIREGKHNIPILLIAGYLPDLAKYFDFPEEHKEQIDAFTKAYAKLTTGQEDGEHDMLIPVKRQLCRTDSFENIVASKDDPVYANNVEIHIEEALHCYNLSAMLSDFSVKCGQIFFHFDKDIEYCINFLGKQNDLY